MLGVMRETLESEGGSISGDDDFFSVASTMPLVAWYRRQRRISRWVISIEVQSIPLIPREVTPWFTALRAYSELGMNSMCFN